MNSALNVVVQTHFGLCVERLFNKMNHLAGNGNTRFGACTSTEQENDVSRAAHHNKDSQEPRLNVVHSWHRKSSFMKIVNKIGHQMAIEDGDGRTFGIESSPICSRQINKIL